VTMLQNDFIAPHVGLALATTTSAYFNALMLAMKLRQGNIIESFSDYGLPLFRTLMACCAMAALIVLLMPGIDAWTNWQWFERTFHLAQIIVPAGLCYALMLWIMGFRRNHFVL
ncbi:MAG: putative peptidoglycan lipid II flippase, partial [Gammaproteobacteria bacterium]